MALASSFGFTNTTASLVDVTPVAIKPATYYAKITDEPTYSVLSNVTAPLDQGEWLSYRANKIQSVKLPASVQYPAKVTDNNVQVVIKLDEILRTSDTVSGEIICDEPISMYLTLRAPMSSRMNDTVITTVFNRLIGAVQKTDGTYRWGELLRSALVPTED